MKRLAISAVLIAVFAGGCSSRPGPAPDSMLGPMDPHLRTGDMIRLEIWREKDMTGDFRIDQNGMVVLPRLGPIEVVGETWESVEQRLVREYGRYLRNPSIQVTVFRPIRILGAVTRPGYYEVDPTTSIGNALALAGGASEYGQQNRVELWRGNERYGYDLHTDLRVMDLPIRAGDQLVVPERSWMSRNAATLISTAVSGITAAVAITVGLTR